jgi:hypothetical protein
LPQAPQFALSVCVLTHAPFAHCVEVFPPHIVAQVPPEQTHWETPTGRGRLWQSFPHAPQLAMSEARLTHAPLQRVSPPAHLQTAVTHCSPPGHALPQAPQLSASLARFTQAMLQLVRGGPESLAQVVVQAPFKQSGWFAGHAFPQRPQFLGFVLTSTQTLPQAARGEQVEPSRLAASPGDVTSSAPVSNVASLRTPESDTLTSFVGPPSRVLPPSGSGYPRSSKEDRPPQPAAPTTIMPIVKATEATKSRKSCVMSHLARFDSAGILCLQPECKAERRLDRGGA